MGIGEERYEMAMRAAVVRSFDHAPRFETFDEPEPNGPHQAVVDVLAAGLHPRVRSGASGRHYTSTGRLPMIPGIDGVGRLGDGRLVYFAIDDESWGSMAERAVVESGRTILLPDHVDVVKVAAAMNPAMSSWVALRRRVHFEPGQSVLILGATGSAGSMAVQVARRLGAARIVGAGRNQERLAALPALGADDIVAITDDVSASANLVANTAGDVDVVLDYVWGEPASAIMMALLTGRADRSRALDWIQIGATAGAEITFPSVFLRSANLRLQGSGQGAVSTEGYLAELPSLVEEIHSGTFRVSTRVVPLAAVERTWRTPENVGERTVLTP
jgi:NADPH:quinone reductase-like Zn-dependent oxidoreductase